MLPRALQGKRALIAGGIATYVGASYAAYSFLKKDKPGGASSSPPTAAGAIASHNNVGTWDSLAASYDSAIDYDETFMGIKLLRRWLVKSAKGRVLEVSAGTGRNLPYYHLSPPPDPDACCVTITDRSTDMLGASQAKASKLLGPTSGEAGCLTFTAADVRGFFFFLFYSVISLAQPLGGPSRTVLQDRGSLELEAEGPKRCSSGGTARAVSTLPCRSFTVCLRARTQRSCVFTFLPLRRFPTTHLTRWSKPLGYVVRATLPTPLLKCR